MPEVSHQPADQARPLQLPAETTPPYNEARPAPGGFAPPDRVSDFRRPELPEHLITVPFDEVLPTAGPPAEQPPSEQPAEADTPPSPSEGTDVPTIPPPRQTAHGEAADDPRRYALARVSSYANQAPDELRQSIIDHVRANSMGRLLIRECERNGMAPEEAALAIADDYSEIDPTAAELGLGGRLIPLRESDSDTTESSGTMSSIRHKVAAVQLETATLRYGKELEASGLRFVQEIAGESHPALRLEDPEAFTTAVEASAMPNSKKELAVITEEVALLVDDAVTDVMASVMYESPSDALDAVNGPPTPELIDMALDPPMSELEDRTSFLESFITHAERLGTALEERGISHTVTEPLHQLAAAHAEGRLPAFVVGRSLGVIGVSDELIGIERLTRQYEFDAIARYLAHLQATAPDSPFTLQVGRTFFRDLTDAITGPDPITPSIQDPKEREQASQVRTAARRRIAPLLRENYHRMTGDLPQSWWLPDND